jgi:hypothetical protein
MNQQCRNHHMISRIAPNQVVIGIDLDYILQSPTLLREVKQLMRYHSANGLISVTEGNLAPYDRTTAEFEIVTQSDETDVVEQVWQLVEEHITTRDE